MTNFNFNSRETYIAFVREWKAQYRDNSQKIRNLKAEIKEAQKSGISSSSKQMSREYMRRVQRESLVTRQEAKIEAQRQWMEAQIKAAA